MKTNIRQVRWAAQVLQPDRRVADDIGMAMPSDALDWPDDLHAHEVGMRWRIAAFIVASVVWVAPATLASFIGVVGLVGWGPASETPGLIDDPRSGSAISALIVSVGAFIVAFVVLFALARWSWPDNRALAAAVAFTAVFWLPVVVGFLYAAQLIGRR